MATVTFLPRPAAAWPAGPSSAVAPVAQGQGFGGVFAQLQPGSDSPDRVAAPHDAPTDAAETARDRPPSDASADQDEDGRDAAATGVGTTVPADEPDRHRVLTGESLPDAMPEATVPASGLVGVPILQVPVTATALPGVTEVAPAAPAGPEPAAPAVTAEPGLRPIPEAVRPAQAGAVVPVDPSVAPPDLSAAARSMTGESAPQVPGPPTAVAAEPAPAAPTAGYDLGDTAAQIVLPGDRHETGRRTPPASGVPAFWAAREVADTEAAATQDTAAPAPTQPPRGTTAPKPDAQVQIGTDALQPGPEEAPLQRETAASLAPAGLQPAAAGPAPAAPLPVPPQPGVPAAPAAMLPPQVPAQIAAALAGRPERPLELRLSPAELGGMTLNLRQDGEILRVVLQADRPDTLDLLRRNGDVLLEELRLAGFAGADLSFADDGGAGDRPEPARPRDAPQADPPRVPPAPEAPSLVQTAQGLDLRL